MWTQHNNCTLVKKWVRKVFYDSKQLILHVPYFTFSVLWFVNRTYLVSLLSEGIEGSFLAFVFPKISLSKTKQYKKHTTTLLLLLLLLHQLLLLLTSTNTVAAVASTTTATTTTVNNKIMYSDQYSYNVSARRRGRRCVQKWAMIFFLLSFSKKEQWIGICRFGKATNSLLKL